MREAFRRAGWLGGVLGVLGFFAPAEGVTYSFKAVKKNGNVINPPVSTVSADPGNTIEIDVFASGWNANLASSKVQTYQFAVNARKGFYNNGGPGFILPKGWNAARDLFMCDSPVDCIQAPENASTCNEYGFCTLVCNTNAECVAANPAYPTCTDSRHCVGANHVPEMGGFINPNRADYIFAPPLVSISAVNTQFLDYGFGATVIGGGDGASDTGAEKYVGTLILVIAPGTCGTYKVGTIDDIGLTFVDLVGGGTQQTFAPTISQLTINLPNTCGACCDPDDNTCSITTSAVCTGGGGVYKGDGTVCTLQTCVGCPTVASSNPPKCAIDARFPNLLNSATERRGFTSVEITYSSALTPPVTPANFTVTVEPTDPGVAFKPVITNVETLPGNAYRLNLDPAKPPPPRQWTCFTYKECTPGPKFCVGALALDVDQNRVAESPADLTSLISALNSVQPASTFYKYDMDRSGAFTSVDLVNWVDLANGTLSLPDNLLTKSITIACPAP